MRISDWSSDVWSSDLLCPQDAAAELDACQQQLDVVRMAEELRIYLRRQQRIGAVQADGAAAFRPQHAGMQAVAMAEMGLARMVVDQGDDEVEPNGSGAVREEVSKAV